MRTSQTIKEKKHEYLVLKSFKGINTQPSREALSEDEFAWLENAMPTGNAFLQVVPALAAATATVTSSIQLMHFASIGTVNYQICFTNAGGAQAVNLGNGSVVTIAAGGTFSTPSMDQWKTERIVIGDKSNGFFSWDGTLFYQPGSMATISVTVSGSAYTSTPSVVLTGGTAGTTAVATATLVSGGVSSITLSNLGTGYTAAPAVSFSGGTTATVGLATATAFIMPTGQNADAVAVYSGRVWLGQNRTLNYTAPNTWFDFAAGDAAGATTITEGSLRQKIYGLEALDNYLYVMGDSSIIIIGDLKVTGSITTFSQTFLSSTTGTTLPATITAMERAILFMNKYGVYALFGASVQKISKGLDGIFPLIDFTQNISAGLVQIYNQLCYAVSFTYMDTNANRVLQAVFFDGKWFLTSQGALTYIAPASINGVLSLWGTTGTDVRQLYGDTISNISSKIQTGLLDLGNPIFDKQMNRAALEFTSTAIASMTLEVDTEKTKQTQTLTGGNTIVWTNNNNVPMVWQNNSAQTITWIATGFLSLSALYDLVGKYIGFTATSTSPAVVVNGFLAEYQQRASWGP